MVNRRPTPELEAARHREIKRRYEHHAKVSKRSRVMAAIRLAELSRWSDHEHGAGTELEPNERSELIARIFTHHLVMLADGNRRAAQWLATYTPWITLRSRETMISEANHCTIMWSADTLAWKIGLKDALRTALKITTIGAIDFSKEQRKARDRKRRAERERNRRAAIKENRVPTI